MTARTTYYGDRHPIPGRTDCTNCGTSWFQCTMIPRRRGCCVTCDASPDECHGHVSVTGGAVTGECWLCLGLGGIAVHHKASVQMGKTLWIAHRPDSQTHPVRPCPVCQGERGT